MRQPLDNATMSASSRRLAEPAAGSRRLNDQVYELLQRMIADRTLRAGTALREGQLVKLFGASRAPVRQALARLHDEGALRKVAGHWHVVGGAPGPVEEVDAVREVDLTSLLAGAGSPQIRKSPAWARIYEQVERVVIHRSAFGSARVNEFELARHYGVGRLVARDVLTRLEGLGMIEKDARQRWLIVALDARRVTDLNEVREQLEPAALRQSCHGLARPELAAMRQRLLRPIESYPHVEPATMNALELDLHVACLARCPNRELLSALRRTHCVLTLSKHVLGVEMPLPDYDPFMVEHLAVLDHLLDGDVLGAVTALGRHLASAAPKVVRRLATFRSEFKAPELSFIDA